MTAGGEAIAVLHVDDDEAFAELVAVHLERHFDDARVETCRDGSEAVARLETEAIDCIVSDFQMPEMNGVELLEAVRERSDVPFILFTGHGSEEVASDAISAGVSDYVQKNPGDDQWLLLANRIERAVREHRAVAQRDESNRRFSTLVKALPGIAYRSRVERGWPVEYVSEGCRELTGYGRDEIVSGEVSWARDIVHPDHRGGGWKEILAAAESGERYDRTYQIITRSGEERWVRDQGLGVAVDGEIVAVEGYVFDVTEPRRQVDELREKESLLDSLFENIPVHLFAKDERARHVRVSSAVVEDPDSFVGKTDPELTAPSGESHRERAYADDLYVLETGEAILDKEEYISSQDRWNLTSKVPWIDDDGEVMGIIGIARDITERKRRKQEIIRQNERLNEFASIVSHDLRNPLNVARGNLELVRSESDHERFETIADSLDRMEEIVDDVLSMARDGPDVLDRTPVRLVDAVEEAWQATDSASATLETPEPLGTIHCDEARLIRLLENLFRNAVAHGSAGDSEANETAVTVRRLADDVGFVVTDDGPGIPESDREQVFERGYTTDETGTGYGLAIVADIADAHGWETRICEADTGGARVEVVTGNELGPAPSTQSNSTNDD
ncbi:response regulator [Haloferax namakaokahaiae]|uniref:histidine kinase n=1 Tax=Haloferax namakaokahaiae TaxID=1748331 RepID=A0ABD5ZFS6_9EURY